MGDEFEALIAAQRAGLAAIAAAAPDDATRAEGEAYFARLCAWVLERSFPAPFAPAGGLNYLRFLIAGANPDYRMGQAVLDPRRRYRLSGRRNGADRIGIGVYTSAQAGLQLQGYVTLDQLDVEADGAFALDLGAGLGGPNTLGLTPASAALIVRELYKRPEKPAAELTLSALGGTAAAVRDDVTPAATAARYRAAAAQIGGVLHRYLQWSEVFARAPNRLTDPAREIEAAVRSEPETAYFTGYFDLAPGAHLEILIPEVPCAYWMIQANTHWLEPIAGAHRNDATAARDPDGRIRIRIGCGGGEAPNWLETRGRTKGTLLYRTVAAAESVVPMARIVAT